MTIKELIEELQKFPQDKWVEVGTLNSSYGVVKRVIDYGDYVEIETDYQEY
jgi:hypothetical protein